MPAPRIALRYAVLLTAATALALPAAPAAAQDAAPPDYREDGPYLLVCDDDRGDFTERNDGLSINRRLANLRLYDECLTSGYRGLAEALAAAGPGTRVQILPGHYTATDTITVDGAEGLQIEGLGDEPGDVHLGAGFRADTVLEIRSSTDVYLRGFTVRRGNRHGLAVADTERVVIENVRSVHNGQIGMRVTDSAHVALRGCSASGNDTAGIAIADTNADITGCDANANLVGLLVLGGGDVHLTDTRLHRNTTGLVITDTTPGHRLTADANRIHDNNADYYRYLGTTACDLPLPERNWSEGVLCPGETVPAGVGVLIAGSNDNTFTGNHIWGQRTAGAMMWGANWLDDDVSHRNRFQQNILGYRDDGWRDRNDQDLWWDGQGGGNCFDEPEALHTTPAVLPTCNGGAQTNRILGEPVKTYKTYLCGTGVLTADTVPPGCDWFGAAWTDRIELQAYVAFGAALLFLTGAGWLAAARSADPPPPMAMTFSAIATGSGALLLILATWSGRSDYEALGIGLWGLGWLLAGRTWYRARLVALGAFTLLIGLLAILDAVDRGAWTLPLVPVSPAWMWLLLLPLWLLLALGTLLFPRRRREPDDEPEAPDVPEPPRVPAYNRFDW